MNRNYQIVNRPRMYVPDNYLKNYNISRDITSTTPQKLVERAKNNVDNRDLDGNIVSDPLYLYTPIRRKGNDIYFYSEVDRYSQMVLINLIQDIKAEIMQMTVEANGHYVAPIRIHINSLGGELDAGLALYDYISNLDVDTIGIVEGIAASAASLILLACKHREMTDNSSILIHQLSSGVIGTYSEITDHMENVDKAMMKLEDIYLNETTIGITPEMDAKLMKFIESGNEEGFDEYYEEIYEDRISMLISILKHDIECTKEECIDFGLIDAPIEEPIQVELTEEDQDNINKYIQKVVKKRMSENACSNKKCNCKSKSKPKTKKKTTKKTPKKQVPEQEELKVE